MAPIFERRKQKSSLPAFLLLLVILAGAGFLIWNLLYTPSGAPKQTVLNIGSADTVTVRLGESTNFVEIPNVGELLEGEAVRSTTGEGSYLVFFDDTKVYLDRDTEVVLSRVRERDQDDSVDIELTLNTGRIWASIPQKINPHSKVLLRTNDFVLETQGGEFSLGSDTIQVAAGRANIFVNDAFYETLEVGQELVFQEEGMAAIAAGAQGPQKSLISADFQVSEWFIKHMNAPGELAVISLPDEESEDDKDKDNKEGESDKEESTSGVRILEPGKNETVVETGESAITITGSVPQGTQKVVVNGYTLTKFKPGDTDFSYNAAVKWGTVKKGANEYTVVAFDKDGNKEEAGITIMYDPDKTTDTDEEKESPKPSAAAPATAEASGDITISAPADGATVNDETITISGKAPTNATRIVVDGYTLSQYAAGSGTWSYRMAERFGNRPTGKTTIEVKAYDAAGSLLGSDQVTITVGKAAVAASSPPLAPPQEVAPPPVAPTNDSSM